MDRRLIFRHPRKKCEPMGDAARTWIGVIDAPVPQGRQLDLEARETSGHEKPAGDDPRGPYRNPTQVCQARIRRRSGEPS